MLIWNRNGLNKDLILDPRLPVNDGEYKRCLDNYLSAVKSAGGKVNSDLRQNLETFLVSRTLSCDMRDLRAGYLGLYRWCVTENKRDKLAQDEARALWGFLFGDLPSRSLADPPSSGAKLVLNESAWQTWVDQVDQGVNTTPGEEDEQNNCEQLYPEGGKKYGHHRRRERSHQLVRDKKASVSPLVCEACGFDFEAQYGELGKDFAECHHKIPLGQADGKLDSKLSDLAILCSNCHRMIHRGGIMEIQDLKKLVAKPWK